MAYAIRSIGENVWTAVGEGWDEPVVKGDNGKMVPKKKNLWMDDEKRMSKMNSRAISAIHSSLNGDQFKQIHDYSNAKEV